MKPAPILVIACLIFAASAQLGSPVFAASPVLTLEQNFATPPDDARPWVYWFWSDGNITREGITADLEAMRRVGIGGVLIMEVDQGVPKGPVRMESAQWRDMFAFSVSEAKRLGLKLIMNNDPGWTGSGGPWNTSENSMQKVVWTEQRIKGPSKFDDVLKQPQTNEGFYRDIAVLAFATPVTETRAMREHKPVITTNAAVASGELVALVDGDKNTGVVLTRPAEQSEWPFVQFAFSEPFEACSLEVTLSFAKATSKAGSQRILCELQASDDGRSFREIARTETSAAPVAFAPVKAKYFRAILSGNDASLDGLRMDEIGLSSAFRINDYVKKSALGLAASSIDVANAAASMSVSKNKIRNLTEQLRDGRLQWDVPEGDWTILRFGHTSTGKTNYPAPADARGLEVDKLSASALDKHFDGFLGKLIRTTDEATTGAGTFVGVHIDSWEVGYQNWTPRFRSEFERLRGYDPLPWMPVLTGRVVADSALSERFLWDVRRTVSDLLNENYAGRMAELARKHGKYFSLEAYRNGPFDPLTYAGRSDWPTGEFWISPDPENLHPSVKTMASAGHIYGKNIVAAEAFTASDLQSRHRVHPYAAKSVGDAAFCAGINHFIVHRYALQPWTDDRSKPGMTMGPWGWEYERTTTWWEQSRPWHEYLARCQHMLQQGRFVADICYLQDEEGIKNPPLKKEVLPAPPKGYDYDFCSGEAVLTRMSAKDGRLVLPDGVNYRILVLPQQRLMTSALLRKIRDLVRDGATVFGEPPLRSPSLHDYPACDDEVRKLVAELWGNCDGVHVKERAFGKGRVVRGLSLVETLEKAGTGPDFAYQKIKDAQARPRVHFIHRSMPDREIYFVANLEESFAEVTASFRVNDRAPQLWRPETGAIEDAPAYDIEGACVRMPLQLAPRESVFVVFKKDRPADAIRVAEIRRASGVSQITSEETTAAESSSDKTPTSIAGDFTYAVWAKPAINMGVPPEDFAGTSALHVARNDVLFPPQGADYYLIPSAAGTGLAVGKNAVCVLEHSTFHFVATLVYKTTLDGWTHIAVVYKDGRPNLYINGRLVRTGLRSLFTPRGKIDMAQDDAAAAFVGDRSAMRLFDRALGETEIRSLMNTMLKDSVTAQPAVKNSPVNAAKMERTTSDRDKQRESGSRSDTIGTDATLGSFAIAGPWTLRFPEGWGAPPEVNLPGLISWSEHATPGVKYFSGTAIYSKTFAMPAKLRGANRRLWLDLGDVQVIAQVKLNGRDLGVLWKLLFRVEVTDYLRDGDNTLEIAVTNMWVNRLIGDEQLPADREWTRVPRRRGFGLKEYPDWFLRGERSPTSRITFTTWKHYEKDAALLASGLLGPVIIQSFGKALNE